MKRSTAYCAAMALGCALGGPALAQAVRPVAPAAAADYQAPLSVDVRAAYGQIAQQQELTLADFALPAGRVVELQLRQFDVFAADAQLVIGTDAGDVPMERPEVALFSGVVAGEADSRVFLSVTPSAVHGFIDTSDERFIVSSGPVGQNRAPVVYSVSATPSELLRLEPFFCAAEELPVLSQPAGSGELAPRGGQPCRIADVAVETDWEFRQIWGNEPDAAAYAAALLGAVSEIYTNDLNMRLRINFLRIWNTSNDPWNRSSTSQQLFQFQDHWNDQMTHIDRNVAHFLSGRSLGGGVAYGDAACWPEFDYGLSANLDGFFPYPLQDNHAQNWDLMVCAHELGHNFGAPHTHSIGIDDCAGGDCSVTPHGTLMSYCHLCDGGMTNIELRFHPINIESEFEPFLNSGQCTFGGGTPSISDQPDSGSFCAGADVTLEVVASGDGTLSYQWQKEGADIAGATGPAYTIQNADAGDAGNYRCVVSNECESTNSAVAVVDICAAAPGDLNGDCLVDVSDLGTLLANFNGPGDLEDGDLTGDGLVDVSDLGELLSHFGEGC